MDFVFAALVASFIGAGLLAGLAAMVIHPRVNQLLSGDWLPEPEGAAEIFEAPSAHEPVSGPRAAQPAA